MRCITSGRGTEDGKRWGLQGYWVENDESDEGQRRRGFVSYTSKLLFC